MNPIENVRSSLKDRFKKQLPQYLKCWQNPYQMLYPKNAKVFQFTEKAV